MVEAIVKKWTATEWLAGKNAGGQLKAEETGTLNIKKLNTTVRNKKKTHC
jgi:hypothetical protein